jgi:hypothetical protein
VGSEVDEPDSTARTCPALNRIRRERERERVRERARERERLIYISIHVIQV